MRPVEHVHRRAVAGRRVRQLASQLAPLIPRDASIVDVGCGDGRLARALQGLRPDVEVRGLDVLVREDAAISVERFDGEHLPLEAGSADVVLFVDVLHHTLNAVELLAQAKRVARRWIIVKDHTRDGLLAAATLRFMDRVGNERHGVALPFEYWSEREWRETFDRLGLDVETWKDRLGLYPFPASLLFDRGLHFIARLAAGEGG